MHIGFGWGNLRGRDHLEDPGVDGRIILRWIFEQHNGMALTELIWHRIRINGGVLCDKELSDSTKKNRKFIDYILMRGSVTCSCVMYLVS